MSKQKRKSTKPHINWVEIMITGLIDLIVGVLLLVFAKLLEYITIVKICQGGS